MVQHTTHTTRSKPVVVKTAFDDAAVLKGMREALGLSQENFANLIGMKRQQLSSYENKHHTPGVQTVADMAAKAGLRVEVTIYPVDTPPSP